MVISSFISSILILVLGIWAYIKLEPTMNIFAEKQLLIEPSKFSYKMWKDMPVTMYQSFTFFNLTNWNQVKSVGQKPRFVEVGPYVYRTIWTKSDVNFMDEDKLVSFAEKKQWIFQAHLSKGSEDDQIWTINTPLMTALALIQNAPVITRNIVSVILDGLGEGAFIKRNIRSLLFEGYSDLIVSVGPLFDRRFSNFNGKFAYLYNKNDSIDGTWTVSTGVEDLAQLNKISRFQSSIVNMTSHSSGQPPQGLNEVKPECASAWSLDQATNGQLFTPFNQDVEQLKLQQQLAQLQARSARSPADSTLSSAKPNSNEPPAQVSPPTPAPPPTAKRFFSRNVHTDHHHHHHQQQQQQQHQQQQQQQDSLVPNPFFAQKSALNLNNKDAGPPPLRDVGKFIFYPDLCRPIHLLPGRHEVATPNGIKASRYYIDPRVFMNSTQMPSNRCYEMNPRPALANALAATINSVTGANVAMPNLVTGASSPFAMFSPPGHHHHHHNPLSHHHDHPQSQGLFERSNHPAGGFLNSALHSFGVSGTQDSFQQQQQQQQQPVSRLGRVRQLFSNIVSQRMSGSSPGSLLPTLAAGPAGLLIGSHHFPASARHSPDDAASSGRPPLAPPPTHNSLMAQQQQQQAEMMARQAADGMPMMSSQPVPVQTSPAPSGLGGSGSGSGSDRWITQFRFKWPRGVFSIGQCQLGAPIYASLPHFLDADEYYLEQVDGLKPNRSLHEFYIDIESTLHAVPVGAKARLQLNVATPELRFRNIPNAMIPVLWQEVTFEIDKPIATMLYWSFTMSSTLYRLIAILLLLGGSLLMLASFVGGFKLQLRRLRHSQPKSGSLSRSMSRGNQQQQSTVEGQRTSWQPHLLVVGGAQHHSSNNNNNNNEASMVVGNAASMMIGGSRCTNNGSNETLDELGHGVAHLNHAFSSCASEFRERLGASTNAMMRPTNCRNHNHSNSHNSDSSNSSINNSASSPKQPSSRASSHCELVSSATLTTNTAVNCSAGCLLACLRHSPPTQDIRHHLATSASSDSSIVVRQQAASASDTDNQATLSSRDSNLDSSSSIYRPHNHHHHHNHRNSRNNTFK